ncbi:MAG: AarF/ABC1/UbiB kinase family protein [Acidimicrobiales bacterium]|nr:AarF/ABC1/UbiB kinase family protein [Acidimicrobiales bacterium]
MTNAECETLNGVYLMQLYDDPELNRLPSFEELASKSKWLKAIPGLPEATMEWEGSLPFIRDKSDASAKNLAKPIFKASSLAQVFLVLGRLILALLMAVFDVPFLVFKRIVNGKSDAGTVRIMEHVGSVLKKSGPSMVKLGQFISTANGILPDNIVNSFAWCRDSVPPLDSRLIRRIITEELDAPPEEIFASFSKEPMAAASIAQAHRAVTKDGRKVVVKVQRPHLKDSFTRDLKAMAIISWALERVSKTVAQANLPGFVELFGTLVFQEIDFRLEACNMVELGLAAEHAEANFVVFPRPIPEFVTPRVLVMEELSGVPYTDAQWGELDDESREKVLKLVISGVIEHTLVYWVFHGDLHAGNVLATPDGVLGLVDYGIVGRLDAIQRVSLVQFLIAFAAQDTTEMLKSMITFGAVPEGADIEKLAKKIDSALPDIDQVTQEQLAETLGVVIKVLITEGFRLPIPLVLFFKNLLYLNGFAAAVAPNVDLMSQIEPIFEYFRLKYGNIMEYLAGELPDRTGWKNNEKDGT